MMFLVLMSDSPHSTSEDFAPLAESEKKQVYELKNEGVITEIYFRSDRDDVVLIMNCESTEEVEDKLCSLPMVKAGLLEYEIIGLRDYPSFS